MPDTPHAADSPAKATRPARRVILHMPMDPATGPFAWHPGYLSRSSPSAWTPRCQAVPYAAGINNHMGSRMTAQPRGHGLADGRVAAATSVLCRQPHQAPPRLAPPGARRVWRACRGMCSWIVRTPRRLPGNCASPWSCGAPAGSAVSSATPTRKPWRCSTRAASPEGAGASSGSRSTMIALRSNQAMAAHGVPAGAIAPAPAASEAPTPGGVTETSPYDEGRGEVGAPDHAHLAGGFRFFEQVEP